MKIFVMRQYVLSFLLLIAISPGVFAQTKLITGKVIDAHSNQPVAGATVTEQNSSNSAVTGGKGIFSLHITPNAAIVVSSVGYVTQTVTVKETAVLEVRLVPDTRMLDDVVVIGYGQARKKDLTGSVVQIRPDNLANENPNTVQDILRGTPGLSVGYDPSAKGGGSMQLRGQRSVYTEGSHNEPLIILDGMIFYGELSEINPDDISQIDVLKDASAAAIYGSRAASGVIIISTKKRETGEAGGEYHFHLWCCYQKRLPRNVCSRRLYEVPRRLVQNAYLRH